MAGTKMLNKAMVAETMMERILSSGLQFHKASWEPMRPRPIHPQVTAPLAQRPHPHPPRPALGLLLGTSERRRRSSSSEQMTGHLLVRGSRWHPLGLGDSIMQGK